MMQVVIDGFSAPLTAGNFAKLVVDGAYDGMKLTCANQAILSDSEVGKTTGYSVPLEIKPAGQFEPLYRTTLSIQVPTCFMDNNRLIFGVYICCACAYGLFLSLRKDGELPVLPLSVYGAVAMAHSDVSDENSSPSQFFFYLYDKRNVSSNSLVYTILSFFLVILFFAT